MIARKRIKSSRYVAAFAVTVLIFLIGFMVGAEINRYKIERLTYLEQDMRIDSLSSELLLQVVQKDLCSSINVTSYNAELSTYGKRITYLESLEGYSDPEIIRLKNYYSLLEIRHWLLSDALNEKCEQNKSLVLYFYSNYNCEDCEDQGLVLTNVHRDYPLFNVYSFEYTLNNSATDYLKEYYNLEKHRLPSLVIDNKVYYGFQSKDFLIEEMNLERRKAEDILLHPELYK